MTIQGPGGIWAAPHPHLSRLRARVDAATSADPEWFNETLDALAGEGFQLR